MPWWLGPHLRGWQNDDLRLPVDSRSPLGSLGSRYCDSLIITSPCSNAALSSCFVSSRWLACFRLTTVPSLLGIQQSWPILNKARSQNLDGEVQWNVSTRNESSYIAASVSSVHCFPVTASACHEPLSANPMSTVVLCSQRLGAVCSQASNCAVASWTST